MQFLLEYCASLPSSVVGKTVENLMRERFAASQHLEEFDEIVSNVAILPMFGFDILGEPSEWAGAVEGLPANHVWCMERLCRQLLSMLLFCVVSCLEYYFLLSE